MRSFSGGEIFALAVGCYVVMGAILVRLAPFRRWTKTSIILHLKSRFSFKVVNVAHRGGSLIGPENTLFTFRKGIQDFGVQLLEMDVNESHDGEVIVSHDASLQRVCALELSHLEVRDLIVAKEPSKNLPQVCRRVKLHFPSREVGYYDADRCAYEIPVNGETRFPLLREVFDAFPGVPIHLDIKYPSRTLTENVVELVEEYKRESITIIGSAGGNSDSLKEILRTPTSRSKTSGATQHCSLLQAPRRSRFLKFASMKEVVVTYALFYLGLLPLVQLDFDVFSIPLPTTSKVEMLRQGTKSCMLPLLAKFLLHSPTLWVHLQRRGVLVLGFVLNDIDEFEEAVKWPVNGIMTDDPGALQAFLNTHDTSLMYTW